jgi:hypothetical protein
MAELVGEPLQSFGGGAVHDGYRQKVKHEQAGQAAYGSGGPEKERDAAARIWVEVPMRDLLRDLPCFGHRYNAPKQRGLGKTG